MKALQPIQGRLCIRFMWILFSLSHFQTLNNSAEVNKWRWRWALSCSKSLKRDWQNTLTTKKPSKHLWKTSLSISLSLQNPKTCTFPLLCKCCCLTHNQCFWYWKEGLFEWNWGRVKETPAVFCVFVFSTSVLYYKRAASQTLSSFQPTIGVQPCSIASFMVLLDQVLWRKTPLVKSMTVLKNGVDWGVFVQSFHSVDSSDMNRALVVA